MKEWYERNEYWIEYVQGLLWFVCLPLIYLLWYLAGAYDYLSVEILAKYYDIRGIKYYRRSDKFSDVIIRL